MKLKEILIDADFCIKVGASSKYRYLERVLKELTDKIFIHKTVYDEIIVPVCVREQIDSLKRQGILEIVDESSLNPLEMMIYQGTYQSLANVMINANKPRKNRGEVCSLAMAKTRRISYFVTDEKDLQTIVDQILNTGIDDRITCFRIEDIIYRIQSGDLEGFKRKEAKILWRLAGKNTEIFDRNIWSAK